MGTRLGQRGPTVQQLLTSLLLLSRIPLRSHPPPLTHPPPRLTTDEVETRRHTHSSRPPSSAPPAPRGLWDRRLSARPHTSPLDPRPASSRTARASRRRGDRRRRLGDLDSLSQPPRHVADRIGSDRGWRRSGRTGRRRRARSSGGSGRGGSGRGIGAVEIFGRKGVAQIRRGGRRGRRCSWRPRAHACVVCGTCFARAVFAGRCTRSSRSSRTLSSTFCSRAPRTALRGCGTSSPAPASTRLWVIEALCSASRSTRRAAASPQGRTTPR